MIFLWKQEKIHHCRACGEGFCDTCSNYRMPCPERGWDPSEPVRVCKTCYDRRTSSNQVKQSAQSSGREPQEQVQARRLVSVKTRKRTQNPKLKIIDLG